MLPIGYLLEIVSVCLWVISVGLTNSCLSGVQLLLVRPVALWLSPIAFPNGLAWNKIVGVHVGLRIDQVLVCCAGRYLALVFCALKGFCLHVGQSCLC